jgi:hypothetical protein
MGTGDFTVEWFSYLNNANAGGVFWNGFFCEIRNGFFIVGSSSGNMLSRAITDYTNKWIHFAITRSGTQLRAFRDGVQMGATETRSNDLTRIGGTAFILIGSQVLYDGKLTNFNWVKGQALYTSDFEVPTTPILPSSGTKLLLRATTAPTVTADSSGLNQIPTLVSGVNFSTETPFSP